MRGVNPHLAAQWPNLKRSSRATTRVLLPLCGKSVDMVYLAGNSAEVVGIDCVPAAFERFSLDNRLPLFKGPHTGNFQVYAATSKKVRPAVRHIPWCTGEGGVCWCPWALSYIAAAPAPRRSHSCSGISWTRQCVSVDSLT